MVEEEDWTDVEYLGWTSDDEGVTAEVRSTCEFNTDGWAGST